MLGYFHLQETPHIFDRVEVRAVRWPGKGDDVSFLLPLPLQLVDMFVAIVLLKAPVP